MRKSISEIKVKNRIKETKSKINFDNQIQE